VNKIIQESQKLEVSPPEIKKKKGRNGKDIIIERVNIFS
jgi:hypothetical protein